MSDTVLQWPTAALARALQAVVPPLAVEVVRQIDSTNTELTRRIRAGRHAPTLLVAEVQTAGRGRLGRAWQQSGAGAALAFSLMLPLARRDWSGLSLAVGVAVAEALHPAIGLKWPNDLWWQDRKLAGILIESTAGATPQAARLAVIGVGVNVAPVADHGFSTSPAWLQLLRPQMDAPAALRRIALPLLHAVRQFEQTGFAPFAARFNALDVLAGRPVRLSDGTEGVACGVDAGGALKVRTGTGMQPVTSGQISVRPQSATQQAARP